MKIRKWSKLFLLFAVFILPLIGFQHLAFSHGGGGGSDGEERDQFSNLASYQGSRTTRISELSHAELNALMHGLNGEVRDALLADFSNWPEGVTVRDLIKVIDSGTPVSSLTDKDLEELLAGLDKRSRDFMLEGFDQTYENLNVDDLKGDIRRQAERDRIHANMAAYWTDKAATSVEVADWVGEKVQFVLGYCPGVGFATSVILDTAREGANERKKGKSSEEIIKSMAVKATSSSVTNYASKADEIFNFAAEGTKKKAVQLATYLSVKYSESKVGNSLEETTRLTGKAINKLAAPVLYGTPTRKNKATKPTYMSSTGYGPGQTHQTQHTAQ
jgi:hypothetical protein